MNSRLDSISRFRTAFMIRKFPFWSLNIPLKILLPILIILMFLRNSLITKVSK